MNGIHRVSIPALLLLCLGLVLDCATVRGADFYQSGTAALEAGDSGQAVRDLEAAARLLPEASEIQNHLGLAYELAGREEDALGAFREAVALDCDNQPAQHNLSLAEAREARRSSP
jgi:Flp pilus assembly protein TadD